MHAQFVWQIKFDDRLTWPKRLMSHPAAAAAGVDGKNRRDEIELKITRIPQSNSEATPAEFEFEFRRWINTSRCLPQRLGVGGRGKTRKCHMSHRNLIKFNKPRIRHKSGKTRRKVKRKREKKKKCTNSRKKCFKNCHSQI